MLAKIELVKLQISQFQNLLFLDILSPRLCLFSSCKLTLAIESPDYPYEQKFILGSNQTLRSYKRCWQESAV